MAQLLAPYMRFIEWTRTYQITFAGYSFTFFDFWLYVFVAGIVVSFLVRVFRGE